MEEQPHTPTAKDHVDRIRQIYADFRESYWNFLDGCTKSLDRATDLNKQTAASYERVLLLDMGILGFSATTLTAVASRFVIRGVFKYAIASLVGAAWLGLLISSLFCAELALSALGANRKLYAEWMSMTFGSHTNAVSGDAKRLSQMSASFLGDQNDNSALLSKAAEEIERANGEWQEHLRAMMNPPARPVSGGRAAKYAIRALQVSMLCLGIAALLLFASAR